MEKYYSRTYLPQRCCATCRHSRYDSDHDERWCGHDTPPNGLGEQLVVDYMGWCGQWEGEPAPPDRDWYERKIPHDEGEVGAGVPAPPQ